MRRVKKGLAILPDIFIERLLKGEEARQEALQNLKTYKGFRIYKYNSQHIQTTVEDQTARYESIVLEFISIVCERIHLPIQVAAEPHDFSNVSGVEIPVTIELPKSMSIQRVRIPHNSGQQDIENMARGIQVAVTDLNVYEIQAEGDTLSQLLPVGRWHHVKSTLKLISFEKDCIYEEYSPQPCSISSCPICMKVVAKKGTEKRLERELQRHLRKREPLQMHT